MVGFSDTVGVAEVGLARVTLAHRNKWFVKRKDEREWGEAPLIPG